MVNLTQSRYWRG